MEVALIKFNSCLIESTGLAADAIRRRFRAEYFQESQNQRQPAHFPPQFQILRQDVEEIIVRRAASYISFNDRLQVQSVKAAIKDPPFSNFFMILSRLLVLF